MHLLHRCLQWHFILFVRPLFLGRICDSNSDSLEALSRGDDDERDRGIWVCDESASLFAMEQMTIP